MSRLNNKGYTIVELMIATTVFSLVMLVCAAAIVYVGKVYYKGVILNRTQDAARSTIDDVTHTIQFGSGTLVPQEFQVTGAPASHTNAGGESVTVNSRCLGQIRYSYVLDRAMGNSANQSRHVLWKDSVPSGTTNCPPANLTLDVPSANGLELLGDTMRIPSFEVDYIGGVWSVRLTISYGLDGELFEAGSNFSTCKGINIGGQFCASSSVDTNVYKRL